VARQVKDRIALSFKGVRGLETPTGKTDQVHVMAFGSIQQAGPNDQARACVKAGKQKSQGGSVSGWGFLHGCKYLLLK